jgi:hypothetical protein
MSKLCPLSLARSFGGRSAAARRPVTVLTRRVRGALREDNAATYRLTFQYTTTTPAAGSTRLVAVIYQPQHQWGGISVACSERGSTTPINDPIGFPNRLECVECFRHHVHEPNSSKAAQQRTQRTQRTHSTAARQPADDQKRQCRNSHWTTTRIMLHSRNTVCIS